MTIILTQSEIDWQKADLWFFYNKGSLPPVSAKDFQAICECIGGINWLGLWAMAIIETGYFRSKIFLEKKNMFGLGAVDHNPLGDAALFKDYHDAILAGAQHLAVYAGHPDFKDKPESKFILKRTSDIRKWGFFGIVKEFSELGGKESNGKVKWASNPNHGKQVESIIQEIKNFTPPIAEKSAFNADSKKKLARTLINGSFKIGVPLLIKVFPWLGWVSFGLYALGDYLVSLF